MLVYKITNLINQKAYIGVTIRTLHNRWIRHKSSAKTGSTSPIHHAIRKYGHEAFSIEELYTVDTIVELKAKEQELIALFETYGNKDKGYNATRGGDGTWGKVHGVDTIARIKASLATARAEGRFLNDEWLANCREARKKQIGVPLTDLHKTNISKALKGRKKPANAGKRPIPVQQFDKDGTWVADYNNMTEAARAINTDTTTIMRCCQGKSKTCRGFVFHYTQRGM